MPETTGQTFPWQRPGSSFASGMVTAGVPSSTPPPEGAPPRNPSPATPSGPASLTPPPGAVPGPEGARRRRRQMLIFTGVAGAILAIGLTILLIVALTSGNTPFRSTAHTRTDVRPPLAQACPAPTVSPTRPAPSASPAPPAPTTGRRTVDPDAGISYKAYGTPWVRWDEVWTTGTLRVSYKSGQHFVTEVYEGGTYHASILSAAVPAADNDAVTLDLKCVGRQVTADVRAKYYPQPNTIDELRDGLTRLGGRPAYVNKFRLHFHAVGLTATEELVAVAVIDVGKPTAAVLYVSIPSTHKQWEYVVDEVLNSVRPS